MRRAILSVSDKRGLIPFAFGLLELGWEIYSTGGTQRALEEAGLKVKSIFELTGFPEILDGRVKTLHPAVYAGILARRELPEHLEELARRGLKTIDLVAVNLYPFKETIRKGCSLEEALENIDIGGPTLIRASAKNFPSVIVIIDPDDYEPILKGLREGEITLEERKRLAYKAFQHVAVYDTIIAQYLKGEEFPEVMTIALKKEKELRYGENPHQKAAFYLEETPLPSYPQIKKLWGRELSYNNILDIDSALSLLRDFASPTVAIIKHTNPCGLASNDELREAYLRAFAGDPIAAFGGVVASNREIDLPTAQEIYKTHYDVVVAPDFSPEALELLRRKKELILLAITPFPSPLLEIKRALGGFLLQTPDSIKEEELQPQTVTIREPNEKERRDLFYAWRAVRHIKSNAIALVKDEAMVGMGAGQPSRVASVEIALKKAGERAKGSVMASDAFFPFPDSVELAGKAGISAIIQPGGSIKDKEVIEMANRYNIAMLFTGIRHFKH